MFSPGMNFSSFWWFCFSLRKPTELGSYKLVFTWNELFCLWWFYPLKVYLPLMHSGVGQWVCHSRWLRQLKISYGAEKIPKRTSSSEVWLEVGSNTGNFASFGTSGYVREHTEFEGLLPQLSPQSNFKFCMFSIMYPPLWVHQRSQQQVGYFPH